ANLELLHAVPARRARPREADQHGRDDHQATRRAAVGAGPTPRDRFAGWFHVRNTLVATARNVGSDHRGTMARTSIAWIAVVFTLSVAVVSALQTGSGGLAIAVSTLAGSAGDVVQRAGSALPLGYAFVIGMASAV